MSTRTTTATALADASDSSLNVCVLIGEVIGEPVSTELHDGQQVTNFDIVTYTDEGRSAVPVVLVNASTIPAVGDHICAVGFVRKRFFRSGPSVQSRTEVVVQKSVKVRQRAQMQRLLEKTADDLLTAG
jgi:hypothetical protein